MKIIRSLIGAILLFLDRVFKPKQDVIRSPDQQRLADEKAMGLTLYQFKACPFCIKVRRASRRLGINLALRDVLVDARAEAELIKEGGKCQVPCLKINKSDGKVTWMFESSDIISYLESNFGSKTQEAVGIQSPL